MKKFMRTQPPQYPDVPDLTRLASLYATAETNLKNANAQLERFQKQLEQVVGCPIVVNRNVMGTENNASLRVVEAEPGTRHYEIDLGPIEPPIEAYMLACQLIRLQMEVEDTTAGEPAVFAPIASRIQAQIPQGQAASLAEQRTLAQEFGQCLIFLPQYMFIDARLREKFPALAPAQEVHALNLEFSRAITVHNHHLPKVGGMTRWSRAYAGLSGAFALQWDHLLQDSKLAEFYRQLPTWPLSERIHAAYQRHQADSRPGAVSRFISQACTLVGYPDVIRHKLNTALPMKGKAGIGGPDIS